MQFGKRKRHQFVEVSRCEVWWKNEKIVWSIEENYLLETVQMIVVFLLLLNVSRAKGEMNDEELLLCNPSLVSVTIGATELSTNNKNFSEILYTISNFANSHSKYSVLQKFWLREIKWAKFN